MEGESLKDGGRDVGRPRPIEFPFEKDVTETNPIERIKRKKRFKKRLRINDWIQKKLGNFPPLFLVTLLYLGITETIVFNFFGYTQFLGVMITSMSYLFLTYLLGKSWFGYSVSAFVFVLVLSSIIIFNIYPDYQGYPLIFFNNTEISVVSECANVSLTCQSLFYNGIYYENTNMQCNLNVSPSHNLDKCADVSTKFNTTQCKGLEIKSINCKVHSRNRGEDCEGRLEYVFNQKDNLWHNYIDEYGVYSFQPYTWDSRGNRELEFDLFCYNDLNTYSLSDATSINNAHIQKRQFLVRADSEVVERATTRISVYLTSLFALFGIISVVYNLRKLYRDEK